MSQPPKKGGSRERVRAYLETHGLVGGLVEFEHSTKTAQEAAQVAGCELGQIVKSLVVIADETVVLALVAGDRRADLDAIAAQTDATGARMGDADTARAATGYAIGGVCPFDLPAHLPVLIDDSLFRFETVYPAAGTPSSIVKLALDDLVELTGGRVARISH
jgi:Cys-tRNA(Pro) deacylase